MVGHLLLLKGGHTHWATRRKKVGTGRWKKRNTSLCEKERRQSAFILVLLSGLGWVTSSLWHWGKTKCVKKMCDLNLKIHFAMGLIGVFLLSLIDTGKYLYIFSPAFLREIFFPLSVRFDKMRFDRMAAIGLRLVPLLPPPRVFHPGWDVLSAKGRIRRQHHHGSRIPPNQDWIRWESLVGKIGLWILFEFSNFKYLNFQFSNI